MSSTDRRAFLAACVGFGVSATFAEALWSNVEAASISVAGGSQPGAHATITREMVKAAEAIAGVSFTDAERDLMLETLDANLAAFSAIRRVDVPNRVSPAIAFSPTLPGQSHKGSSRAAGVARTSRPGVRRPASDGDLPFLTVVELAELLRSRQITSTELTQLYLGRLRRHDAALNCVATLTEERALRAAAAADKEIAAGQYRGPLHGIPYGVKDIFAVPGYPTTWGAATYRNRIINSTATVVQKLDAAGAVLVAKLAMGELGLNDRWFGGFTRSPWQPKVGAKGSSSGSAVATSAGLVGFAIGAETMGSIVVPANRNGVTGLRPTFGRVSRHGAMTLCWSLDKIGPLARSVEDCAVVLEAIAGPDGRDPSVTSLPYAWDHSRPLSSIRVGYFKMAFDFDGPSQARNNAALAVMRDLTRTIGAELVPVEMPTDIPINSLMIVRVEAAAALEEIASAGGLARLSEQHAGGWPNFVRSAQFVPAVDYIQANRLRTMLMERVADAFRNVDVIMAPTFSLMPMTNLTGHPCVVVPNGLTEEQLPASVSFIGRLYGEAELCTVARAWQQETGFHLRHPPLFEH
jgi:Asp-tRNA(Asn)/Glu-tRNA(Gln) amidotransferase A subunit family amidase